MTEPSVEELRTLFVYDPESGVLTFRKGARAGKPAGWVDTLGYARVWAGKKKYASAKIAWTMMTGTFPKVRLFTLDRNKLNLKWDNLVVSHRGMYGHSRPTPLRPLVRMIEPRINVTAALMGDPPPGRSMLDGYKHASTYNPARSTKD